MKHSELEKDAAHIPDKLRQLGYEIPSDRQTPRVIFYKLVIVCIFQLLFIVPDILTNSDVNECHCLDAFVLSLGSDAFLSLAFLMSAYNLINLRPSLGSEITERSVLLKLVERKINSYSLFLLAVNVIAGYILLSSGERFVAGLEFSWFVMYLISTLTLQTSLSRYMTPAVASSLLKVKELLSASPKQASNFMIHSENSQSTTVVSVWSCFCLYINYTHIECVK